MAGRAGRSTPAAFTLATGTIWARAEAARRRSKSVETNLDAAERNLCATGVVWMLRVLPPVIAAPLHCLVHRDKPRPDNSPAASRSGRIPRPPESASAG